MGGSGSRALPRELVAELQACTRLSEAELRAWHARFRRQCPGGRISRADFERLYGAAFPCSEARGYAGHVFRSLDTNDDGSLDFREYVLALHVTAPGRARPRLEWAFSLFDVDRNGEVSKGEVLEIVTAVFQLIPPEERLQLPEDENSPEKRADKVWRYFNKGEHDKIVQGEFIDGVMNNDDLMRLIQYEPKK